MTKKHKFYLGFKYSMDWIIAFFSVLALSPLLFLVSILVAVDGKGSVIFRQEREGNNREIFYIYKFRTMKSTDIKFNKDKPIIPDDNENLTWIGGLLRKTKLDELPQLFNILRGEMSFVGPRPLMPVYSKMFRKWEFYKFSGRPGMTGLAQVNGNGHLSVIGRNYYDILYNERVNFFLDVWIVFKTFLVIFFGEGHFKREPTKEQIKALVERYDD